VKYLKEYVKKVFLEKMEKIMEEERELYLETINVNDDHVHIQIEIPPSTKVSNVVQKIKKETSKELKKRYKFIREMYLDGRIWSVGYFSSTVGLDEKRIKKYIEYQDKREDPKQIGFEFS
jgi:putative transposase